MSNWGIPGSVAQEAASKRLVEDFHKTSVLGSFTSTPIPPLTSRADRVEEKLASLETQLTRQGELLEAVLGTLMELTEHLTSGQEIKQITVSEALEREQKRKMSEFAEEIKLRHAQYEAAGKMALAPSVCVSTDSIPWGRKEIGGTKC